MQTTAIQRDRVVSYPKLDDDSVIVWSDAVNQPVAVRYACADNPVGNLFNSAGLPMMPFPTDEWEVKEVKASAVEKIPQP